MLDISLFHGFYEPKLVNARRCFHSFESLKTKKEDSSGVFFLKFSMLSPKKYKAIHRRNLLAKENYGISFL